MKTTTQTNSALMRQRPYKASYATRASLQTIFQSSGKILDRLLDRDAQRNAELIAQVAAADELTSVMELIDLLSHNKKLVPPAVDAISTILDRRDPLQLALLDDRCRKDASYYRPVWNWRKTSKDLVETFDQPGILGLFSMHPNGHVREAAIRKLGTSDGDQTLTFLLLRSNDWVVPVRNLALAEVIKRVRPEHLEAIIANLKLIERCSAKNRGDFSETRAAIDDLLVQHPDRLERVWHTADFRVRRAIFRLSSRFESNGYERFFRLALRDDDPLLRLQATRSVAKVDDLGKKRELIDALIRDPAYPVRITALRLSLEDTADRKEAVLQSLVVDRSHSVRNAARFHLRREGLVQGDEHFVTRYSDAIAHGDLVAGLAGLGECGSSEDLTLVEQYLSHERPKVAAAALASVCRLSDGDEVERLLEFLKHSFARCSRVAAERLSDIQGPLVHEACLTNIRDVSLAAHVRRNSLRISLQQTKWFALEAIVAALDDTHGDLQAAAESALSFWGWNFNRSFVAPSGEQKERLLAAMEVADMDESRRRGLVSLLS